MAEKQTVCEAVTNEEEPFSLETSFRQLDEMIEKLQSKDISLNDAVETYAKGMELCSKCAASIDLAEKTVLTLRGEDDILAF